MSDWSLADSFGLDEEGLDDELSRRRLYRRAWFDGVNAVLNHWFLGFDRTMALTSEFFSKSLYAWQNYDACKCEPPRLYPICVYCGKMADSIDHIIPKSRGGTDDKSNLALCCRSCNSSKNNKMLWEWGKSNG